MATGINSRFAQEMGDHLASNFADADRLCRAQYGMGYDELNATVNILSGLARGELPTPGSAEEKYVHAAAQARYGMSAKDTNSLLREISRMPADQRINAYFTAGGRSQSDPNTVRVATKFVGEFAHQNMQQSLSDRLDKRESNHAHRTDRFTNLKPDSRALEDVKNRQHLRDSLRSAMGADTSKPSIQAMRERVNDARFKLADRIDASAAVSAATGKAPDLKSSLSENFDLHYLDGASKDLGMPSITSAIDKELSSIDHLHEDYDVTANLRSNHD